MPKQDVFLGIITEFNEIVEWGLCYYLKATYSYKQAYSFKVKIAPKIYLKLCLGL